MFVSMKGAKTTWNLGKFISPITLSSPVYTENI
jgi:hypothetical protein